MSILGSRYEDVRKMRRITLRLAGEVFTQFQKEADEKDMPLSSLMAKSLYKTASFDLKFRSIPTIVIPELMVDAICDELSDASIDRIAKELGPKLSRKAVLVSGTKQYELDNVIEMHLKPMAKYCQWFRLECYSQGPLQILTFQTKNSTKWSRFLAAYIRAILDSLSIRIAEEIVEGDTVAFKLIKP